MVSTTAVRPCDQQLIYQRKAATAFLLCPYIYNSTAASRAKDEHARARRDCARVVEIKGCYGRADKPSLANGRAAFVRARCVTD
jgi:hypothetical protein